MKSSTSDTNKLDLLNTNTNETVTISCKCLTSEVLSEPKGKVITNEKETAVNNEITIIPFTSLRMEHLATCRRVRSYC